MEIFRKLIQLSLWPDLVKEKVVWGVVEKGGVRYG